jgi:hypothetical protein
MAYVATVWENREVEFARRYIMTTNADGTVTLTPSEGTVFANGTPLDAANLNKLEQQVAANDANKVERSGDTLTGNLTAPIFNATQELQQNGVSLANTYQPKGNYQPSGQYPTWEADPNGVSMVIGKLGGTGKPIRLYLTSAQPAASSTEIRAWIQIDKF